MSRAVSKTMVSGNLLGMLVEVSSGCGAPWRVGAYAYAHASRWQSRRGWRCQYSLLPDLQAGSDLGNRAKAHCRDGYSALPRA